MFDDFLRKRAEQTGEQFVPFDPHHDYDRYVDGLPRSDGVRSFLASRKIELPDGDPNDPPDAETIAGLGNRKNELVLQPDPRAGRRAVRRLGALRQGRRAKPGCAARSSPRARTAAAVLEGAGMIDLFDEIVDGVVLEREQLKGKPAPDSFLFAARALGVEPAEAAVFEDALAGVAAGRAGRVRLRRRGRPRRASRRVARARRRRRRSRPRRAAGATVIAQPSFAVEPWSLRETELDLDFLAQTESVFALANGHIGLRGNLDEGEPNGLPGTLPQLVLRAAAAAVRGRRLRLPRIGPDARQRHRRQDRPPARRRRAVRRALREAPLARARARLPRGRARSKGRLAVAGQRRRPRPLDAGSSRSPSAPSPRSSTRWSRSTGRCASSSSRSWSRTSREPRRRRPIRAQHPCSSRRSARRSSSSAHPARCLLHSTKRSELRMGAGDGPHRRRPRRHRLVRGVQPRCRPRDRHGRSRGGRPPPRREVPGVRLVEPAQRPGDPRPGHRGARRGAAHRLGRPPRGPARVPRRFLGSSRRRARGRPRASASRALRALPHASGGSPRRAARDRRQRPDRARLRRPHVLGHGALRAAGPHLHGAGRRRRRAPLAPFDSRPRPRAGDAARARGRRLPVAHDPRTGVLRLLACRHGRVPHQRRHRRRGRALLRGDGGRHVRSRGRRRAARRDGAPVAVARPSRSAGSLPHRRRHRSGRVQRDRRQQRLHEPARAEEPARRGGRGRSPPAPRRRAGRRLRGSRDLARRCGRHGHSRGTRRSASIPSPKGSPSTRCGTSSTRGRSSTRCSCTSPTSTSTGSRWSSRRTSSSRCTGAAMRSPTRRRQRDFDYYER